MLRREIQAVLRKAASLVRKGWCRHALAKDKQGRTVGPRDPSATSWCALGAIDKICGGPEDGWAARVALGAALGEGMSLNYWNDSLARTQEEVIQKFEEAALLLSDYRRANAILGEE